MKNKMRYISSIIILVVLLGTALFLPKVYFAFIDSNEYMRTTTIDKETAIVVDNENTFDNIKLGSRLVENVNSINMQALQKNGMSDSEFAKLFSEINKLIDCGLITEISSDYLKNHLVYIAYYNVLNPTDESIDASSISLIEYKFSDYSNFEYTFWMDGKTDLIYEVTLVDQSVDFTLSELEYMNGISKYYGIDNVSPVETLKSGSLKYFQISYDDYHGRSYYSEFSIYNQSSVSFVVADEGVNWSILSIPLSH